MKIIRPYGFSQTKREDGRPKRKLVVANADGPPLSHDIPTFASRNSRLVIGQWISLIDKIARKPKGASKPTPEQRAFRQGLGQVCWELLSAAGAKHLSNMGADGELATAHLWWSRVHPYAEGAKEVKPNRKTGKLPESAKIQGRLYGAFAGRVAPAAADKPAIAKAIEAELYGDGARKGLIETRARSIEGNVLQLPPAGGHWRAWLPSSADINAYCAPGDPAALIRERARTIEDGKGRMSHAEAAKVLYEHWGKVFRGDDGAVLSLAQASETHKGLLALHDSLRLCYRALLKRTRKDTGKHRNAEEEARAKTSLRLSVLLPRNLDEARKLIDKQRGNSELAERVRVGKIIHYSAPPKDNSADHPARAIENWPQGWRDEAVPTGHWLRDIAASEYLSSDGQAEIKRAEAFVRMWRQALVLARWTLTDWVSMKGTFPDDVFGGECQLKKALDIHNFDRDAFRDKLRLLFGLRAETFEFQDDEQRLEFLGGLIAASADLRHATFHFKGRQDLLNALAQLPNAKKMQTMEIRMDPVMAVAGQLWEVDASGRFEQLRATLVAVQAEDHLTQCQGDQILPLVTRFKAVELPLPRFSRILVRRQNICADGEIALPVPAKRSELEIRPDRRCQYTIIKLVYERPFRAWLAARGAPELQAWIGRAVGRANREAQKLQGEGKSAETKALIVARADRLKDLAGAVKARSAMIGFVAELSRESASETRIQRGYESDAESAREQAEFIEDLLCDVTLLAFDHYLKVAGLDWLREPPQEQATPCVLPRIAPTPDDIAGEDWQKALYLILHLVPVESVNQLQHQLVRWDVAAGGQDKDFPEPERARLDAFFAAMTLYLDMHDAKFTGDDMALAGCEDFKRLFASGDKGFNAVFPKSPDEKTDHRLPRRGLREIARFGHLPVIETLCGRTKISDDTIAHVMTMEMTRPGEESQIAKWQKVRAGLHERLASLKKFDDHMPEVERYARAVAIIAYHREASNFVNLVDHVRAHRLIMAVWSRLVDSAGLFERDLYFVTLALLHGSGMAPADLLKNGGVNLLKRGQAISALAPRNRWATTQANALFAEIKKHFSDVWGGGAGSLKEIRNRLAHLDLRGMKNSAAAPAPKLTDHINDARRLMAYDRKMKNAVTKSVIELMQREGIDLSWSIPEGAARHGLTQGQLSSRTIQHLNGILLYVRGRDSKVGEALHERLMGDACVKMLAAAFNGRGSQTESVVEIIEDIDFARGPFRPPSLRRG